MTGISGTEQLAILFNKCLEDEGLELTEEQTGKLWRAFGKFAAQLVEALQ